MKATLAAVRRVEDAFGDADVDLRLVGGSVRDLAMDGREPKDYDYATPALPDQVSELLDPLGSVYEVGKDHGTIAVDIGGTQIEVTTFRVDTYPDPESRTPEVTFGGTLDDDLARRDFTINAMAMRPDGSIHDPFGGNDDIEEGVVRCVGDPHERFDEDPLRVMRGLRFASTLGFCIDDDTSAAMSAHGKRLAGVSLERIQAEVDRVISEPDGGRATHQMVLMANNMGLSRSVFGTDVGPVLGLSTKNVTRRVRLAALSQVGVDLKARRWSSTDVRDATSLIALTDTYSRSPLHAFRATRDDDELAEVEALAASRAISTTVRAHPEHMERLRAPLPIDGNDAVAAGLSGRDVGSAMAEAEDAYVNSGGLSDRDALLEVLAGHKRGAGAQGT